MGAWPRTASYQPNSLLFTGDHFIYLGSLSHKYPVPSAFHLWAFATARRESCEIPSAAVAAQMSWNTFKKEGVSRIKMVCDQLCLMIQFSHIQQVFSVFEPFLHLQFFSTWQETSHFATLGQPVGGGKMGSECLCQHPVLLKQPQWTQYGHWNCPVNRRILDVNPDLHLSR